MNYLIDTCSLVNLVRYYLPFDAEKKLYDCFKKQYERQEFILLPEVYKECSWGSQKVVTNSLDFLENLKKTPAICKSAVIPCITLPELLKNFEVHIDFSIPS